MKRIVLAVCVGLMSLGGGCAQQKKVEEAPPKVTEIPAQSFARQWSLEVKPNKGAQVTALHESGDYLFAITSDNFSYVIKKDTGAIVSIHEIRAKGKILPPFTNGNVFVYAINTELLFYGSDGKLQRNVPMGAAIRAKGAFSTSTVYLGTTGMNGGRLRAIDPTKQYHTTKWEVLTAGALIAAPVFHDGVVYFATEDGKVYAVTEEKQAVWPLDRGFFQAGPVIADLAADDSGVYVPSLDTRLLCLSRADGRIQWQYFATTPLDENSVPTLTADTVFLPVRGRGLVALPKLEGDFTRKPLWTSSEATNFLAEDDKYAYARLRGNAIGALNKSNGTVAFRSGRSDMDFFVPNGRKDALIFGATKSGYVVAAKPITRPGTMGELIFTR